ncbi:MAG: TrkH family potassium uptake protein [Longicatena sp.]
MVNFVHSVLGFKKMSPAQKIASSFLLVILTGTLLLTLPISNTDGGFLNPLDALFSATSATCVTGLTVIDISSRFNWFGQTVMMLLIQVGGLGLMTFMAIFLLIIRNRLSVNEKIAMKEMLNQDYVINMRKFLLDILYYTLFFETIGAILISIRMIPEYGLIDGGFKSIFFAISAFCNAGFDTLGTISLQGYVHDPLMCITIMALIILGGIGFAVWFDIRDKIGPLIRRKITFKRFKHMLSLHTKIVLLVTTCLIVIPGLMIMFLEFGNPKTMGGFSIPEKFMSAMFESIALRTAGFTSIDYAGLNPATSLVMMILMFIGGSPGGTAGGIKTTTFAVLVIYIICMLRGKEHTTAFKRTIENGVVIRAMGIFFINLVTLFTGIFLLCIFEQQDFIKLCFEAVSAMATVGSSLGITSALGVAGKIIIILLMYIGRIGISTLILSLMRPKFNKPSNKLTYPDGNIIVG